MKAMLCTRNGSPDVLRLAEVKTPVPGDTELLVDGRAASVNAVDWHFVRDKPLLVPLPVSTSGWAVLPSTPVWPKAASLRSSPPLFPLWNRPQPKGIQPYTAGRKRSGSIGTFML